MGKWWINGVKVLEALIFLLKCDILNFLHVPSADTFQDLLLGIQTSVNNHKPWLGLKKKKSDAKMKIALGI